MCGSVRRVLGQLPFVETTHLQGILLYSVFRNHAWKQIATYRIYDIRIELRAYTERDKSKIGIGCRWAPPPKPSLLDYLSELRLFQASVQR